MDIVKLEAELTTEEGNIPHMYFDDRGFATIGIGTLIDARKGGRLTPDEILYIFHNRVQLHMNDIAKALPWAVQLSDARQRALVNMCFQMGIEGLLMFKDMLLHLQAGQYAESAAAALDSDWAKETPERAARVANMIRVG